MEIEQPYFSFVHLQLFISMRDRNCGPWVLYCKTVLTKMDAQNAQKSWALANNIEPVSGADEIYRFDSKQQQDILTAKPWEKECVNKDVLYMF